MPRLVDPRLTFLLWFASIDLEALDKRGWIKLRGALRRFIRHPRRQRQSLPPNPFPFNVRCNDFAGTEDPVPTDPRTALPHQFKQVQVRVRRLVEGVVGTRLRWESEESARLRALARGSTDEEHFGRELSVSQIAEKLRIWVSVTPNVTNLPSREWREIPRKKRPPLSESAELSVTAPFEDAVVFLSCLVLWMLPTNTVRRCQRCGRLFAAPRSDSKGCSLACTKALYWERPKGRKKLREKYEEGRWRRGTRLRARRRAEKSGRTTTPLVILRKGRATTPKTL